MKLYRPAKPLEINSDPNCVFGSTVGFGFFMPIEITEEEIEKAKIEICHGSPIREAAFNKAVNWLLSKLMNE